MTVDISELMRRVAEKERENERRQDEALTYLREIRPRQPRIRPPRTQRQPTWEDLTDLAESYSADAPEQYADLPTLESIGIL